MLQDQRVTRRRMLRQSAAAFAMGQFIPGKVFAKKGDGGLFAERPRPLLFGVPDSGGQWNGVHVADLRQADAFDGVREFYVHLRQRNGSRIRSHVSSRLKTLQIKASVARESQSD